MRLSEHGGGACPLDQRAHPPRRCFTSAGKGEEREAEPSRDIAYFGRRALRGQRVVTAEIDRKRSVARRFKSDIRFDVAERQAPLRVEDEAELSRQSAQGLVHLEPPLQRRYARSEVEQSFGIEVVQRTCYDIAQALDRGIGINEARGLVTHMQARQSPLAQ